MFTTEVTTVFARSVEYRTLHESSSGVQKFQTPSLPHKILFSPHTICLRVISPLAITPTDSKY